MKTTIFFGILSLGLAIPAMATNILVNPSFEQDVCSNSSFCGGLTTGITGWTITAGNVDLITGYWNPGDAHQSLDLNGTAPATIAQTFNTLAGTRYRVAFSLAGNLDGGPLVKTMLVTVDNVSQSFGYDITNRTPSDMGWEPMFLDFVASGSSATVQFASTTAGGAFGPALDNTGVDFSPAAVPEPSTFVLLGSAVAGLTLLRRRR